jgi:hypothetical protein
MANIVVDPKIHAEAIIPDLSKPDPLVKFTRDQEPHHVERLADESPDHPDKVIGLSVRTATAGRIMVGRKTNSSGHF